MLGSDSQLLPVSMMMIARVDRAAGPTKSQNALATPTARDCASFDDIATPFFEDQGGAHSNAAENQLNAKRADREVRQTPPALEAKSTKYSACSKNRFFSIR